MFAAVAAVIFGLGILLELGKVSLGRISMTTVILAGLLALALHLAGVGVGGFARRTSDSPRRSYRRRR